MFNFSVPELALVLGIALIVFGPGKLPEVGKALGKGIQEFKKATTTDLTKEDAVKEDTVKVEPKSEEKK
jgi:sec-independent protein translocase protein TatA